MSVYQKEKSLDIFFKNLGFVPIDFLHGIFSLSNFFFYES